MPRPRLVDRPIDKKVSLRTTIVEAVDEELADKLTGKPRYGAWTELVESLLNAWLCGEVDVRLKPRAVNLDDLLPGKETNADPRTDVSSSDSVLRSKGPGLTRPGGGSPSGDAPTGVPDLSGLNMPSSPTRW